MKDLVVCGYDVMALGVAEGPLVGAILKEVLDRVIDGDLENDREQLLEYCKNRVKGEG